MNFQVILTLIFCICGYGLCNLTFDDNFTWPIPYERLPFRPENDKFCQALYQFCPTGLKNGTMPKFQNNDVIEVYALQTPVWEFKYGSFMKRFNVMHDALGFRSVNTGLNYTMEWYELDQLLNCTFPHLLNGKDLKWCNQGAGCIYRGINDIHWSQNGSITKVAKMSALQFQKFSEYAIWNNNTAVFYETFSVLDKPDNGQYWFQSHDCATFVLESFQAMSEMGVNFNLTLFSPKYTRINLYSDRPMLLGNISTIQTEHPIIYKDMLHFYGLFQAHLSIAKTLEHAIELLYELLIHHKFYFYYNQQYWYLPMKYPFVKLVYEPINLP